MRPPQQPKSPRHLPRGIIPLVEPSWSHHEFINQVQPPFVLIKITNARQLLKRGEDADSYFGHETTVITSTTVPDNSLFCLHWERELEIIQDFGADYHIPADTSIYLNQDPDEREELVKQSLRGFIYMYDQIEENPEAFNGDPPTLIPIIKGVTDTELDYCFRVCEEYDVRLATFYATQYFTGGDHARHYELVDDLKDIHESMPNQLRLFIIGTLGQSLVPKFPDSVVAAAGMNQWKQCITPRTQSTAEMVRQYTSLAEDINIALDADVVPSYSERWEPFEFGTGAE